MSTTVNDEYNLPDFDETAFVQEGNSAPECDMIMKGGITSGIVYPYAVLQIATKYRLRSLGGTSAGGIAAAFAAAAEYARRNNRPEGFITMKKYCDALPTQLPSLFQPAPEFECTIKIIKPAFSIIKKHGVKKLLSIFLLVLFLFAIIPAFIAILFHVSTSAIILAAVSGVVIYGICAFLLIKRVAGVFKRLPENNFGFCTGLTQNSAQTPAVTDWIYHALQDIAFGDPNHLHPLTFGDLCGPDKSKPDIDLKMVTTNLSMGRPHTLPSIGISAGFRPQEWNKLFPQPVMNYLINTNSSSWEHRPECYKFPDEEHLPVIVAVRMSLSFPLLFTTVPLETVDFEQRSIINALGGERFTSLVRTTYFSDGGLSSNFPVHMFDAPLPSRPTFAFNLEDLPCKPTEVLQRVMLPDDAKQGMGVQVRSIGSLPEFGMRIIDSAKGWQDQLLSEITGQRERIIRIFLADNEGGLNLTMSPETSKKLMYWGYQAGCKFTNNSFNFNEHKWRRLLVLHKHLEDNMAKINQVWNTDYSTWYQRYSSQSLSYNKFTPAEKQNIETHMLNYIHAFQQNQTTFVNPNNSPKKAGVLKIAPKY